MHTARHLWGGMNSVWLFLSLHLISYVWGNNLPTVPLCPKNNTSEVFWFWGSWAWFQLVASFSWCPLNDLRGWVQWVESCESIVSAPVTWLYMPECVLESNSFGWDSPWAHSFLLKTDFAWLFSRVHWSHFAIDFVSNGQAMVIPRLFCIKTVNTARNSAGSCCDSPWGKLFYCFLNQIQLCQHAQWIRPHVFV